MNFVYLYTSVFVLLFPFSLFFSASGFCFSPCLLSFYSRRPYLVHVHTSTQGGLWVSRHLRALRLRLIFVAGSMLLSRFISYMCFVVLGFFGSAGACLPPAPWSCGCECGFSRLVSHYFPFILAMCCFVLVSLSSSIWHSWYACTTVLCDTHNYKRWRYTIHLQFTYCFDARTYA